MMTDDGLVFDDLVFNDLVFNGIDATTGDYLHPPIPLAEMHRVAGGQPPNPRHVIEARAWRQKVVEPHLDARHGIDTRDLAQTGWGVIISRDADPAVREALGPLLRHRKRLATRNKEHYYREFSGEQGYQLGDSKLKFLARHGAGPGPADPERVPYYLLLVGGPEEIPYHFQARLDVQYAVGRLALPNLDDYERYAAAVVAAEEAPFQPNPRAVFFGVCNPDDRTTGLTSKYLVGRVASFLENSIQAHGVSPWTIDTLIGGGTCKARLMQLLGEASPAEVPSLLFTASHGMGFPSGDDLQARHQGALLCQDWPGPKNWRGPIPQDYYLAGDDLTRASRSPGLIAFHYACHGAGTPQLDAFSRRLEGSPRTVAPQPFVAHLPQRLLAGGALAVIGHIERSWGYSFIWKGAGGQSQVFEDTLQRLIEGYPVGAAMEPFSLRYAELASDLAGELENAEFGIPNSDPEMLPRLWTATNDARNYVVLGDPAVRLKTVPKEDTAQGDTAREKAGG